MKLYKSYIATLLMLVLSLSSCTDEYPDGSVVSDIPSYFIIDKEFTDSVFYTSDAREKSITIDVKNINWIAECNATWVKLEKIDETTLNVSISANSMADIREAVITFKNVDTGALLKELPMFQYGCHEAVDLGLSVKWAICNVGALKPEDYGDYYAWGEIETKNDYSWSTYKWCNGSKNSMTKYCTDSSYGIVDNKTDLDPEDDVAHVKWGGDWRMPTKAEIQELTDKCTWIWTTQNGVYGNKVTGPNGNSIFLPAAGGRYGTDLNNKRETSCVYWSSSLYQSNGNDAYSLYFYGSYYDLNYEYRYCGYSVRPVSE